MVLIANICRVKIQLKGEGNATLEAKSVWYMCSLIWKMDDIVVGCGREPAAASGSLAMGYRILLLRLRMDEDYVRLAEGR